MDKREKELDELKSYINKVNTEITMVFQSLQWDRKRLLEDNDLVTCSVNKGHRIPYSTKRIHEKKCLESFHGYTNDDKFLPDPIDESAPKVLKYSKNDITNIIMQASKLDPTFKKGPVTNSQLEPLTFERLQATYTADERRALYDAVVASGPTQDEAIDVMIASGEDRKSDQTKSKSEVLAELRDMKRRRTKYRVAAKTKNYSDVLRDVITTQMELYTDVQSEVQENLINTDKSEHGSEIGKSHQHAHRHRYDREDCGRNLNETDKQRRREDSKHIYENKYREEHDRNSIGRGRHDRKEERSSVDKRRIDNKEHREHSNNTSCSTTSNKKDKERSKNEYYGSNTKDREERKDRDYNKRDVSRTKDDYREQRFSSDDYKRRIRDYEGGSKRRHEDRELKRRDKGIDERVEKQRYKQSYDKNESHKRYKYQ